MDNDWREWIYNLAACEIENILSFNPIPFTYLEIIKNWFNRNFVLEEPSLTDEEKEIQVFIAICRAFLKLDNSTLNWYVFKRFYSSYSNPSELLQIKQEIEKQISHPIGTPLFRFIRPLIIRFIILKEIIEKNLNSLETIEEIFSSKEKLKEKITEICEEKYFTTKQIIKRGITRSIIYIFTTKVLLAFILEIPYEMLFFKKINPFPIIINALFPPLLMFGIGSRIKTPGEENTKKLIQEIFSFVYNEEKSKEKIPVFFQKKEDKRKKTLFLSIYGFLFVLIFSLATFLLIKLHFNILGIIIFFVFLSLVLLFGFRVQYNASEIFVIEQNEGLFYNIIDNLSLPFLNLGIWLSKYFSKLNLLMIIMDFLIEAPLKSIIKVVDEWLSFIQEKKREVIEVPS